MGYTLGIIGCGTMGTAVLNATLKALENIPEDSRGDNVPTGKILVSVNSEESKVRLSNAFGDKIEVYQSTDEVKDKSSYGGTTTLDANNKIAATSDVIIIGCKPFIAASALTPIESQWFRDKTVISLMAGLTIEKIIGLIGTGRLTMARAMTNTPSKIGHGMTVVSAAKFVDGYSHCEQIDQRANDRISWLFNNTGKCVFLDEKHQDVATALCGSGPAFVYVMIEALIEGAVQKGMPYKVAQECAAQVLIGAGKLVQESGEHPAALKSQVCTPGGTTIGGLLVMEDNKVRSGISRAVEEATNIATELGKK